MKRKRTPIERNSRVRRQRDPIPWKYCVLTIVCGLLLVAGFFLAARQHFRTVQVGMVNAEMRVRISKLKDENRKLLISKERASTPSRIVKLAVAHGFRESPPLVLASTVTPDRIEKPSAQNAVALSSQKDDERTASKAAVETVPGKTRRAKDPKKSKTPDEQIAALLSDLSDDD